MPYLSEIGSLERSRQQRPEGWVAYLSALADSLRTGTRKYFSGDLATQRYMPTLDEAAYRIEQLRKGTPISQEGPGMSVPTARAEDYIAGSLDAVTPLPLGALTFEQAAKNVPGFRRLGKYLTDEERALFESPAWKKQAQSVVDLSRKVSSPAERAAVATAGGAKRGWYADSEKALRHLFDNPALPDDPERFTALLAALSPQTSVQSNLKNALSTWRNWTQAGRPTDTDAILRIMGRSVEGDKGAQSVLDAWRNNAYRALTAPNAAEMLATTGLSGPKVQSFARNLMGDFNEVTNDAWMAKLGGIDQGLFSGAPRASVVDRFGNPGLKGPGYLAENIATRRGAEMLGWTPAEIQETSWSFGKTLQDLATQPEAIRKSMREFGVEVPPEYLNLDPMTAVDALSRGLLTDEAIAAVPAFGDLVRQQPYRGILEGAGYSTEGLHIPRGALSSPYERLGVAPGELGRNQSGRHVLHAAKRLDLAIERAEALSAIDQARKMQGMAQTSTQKRQANQALGQAKRKLRRSASALPNVVIKPEYRVFLP